jgi:hypothetical protein
VRIQKESFYFQTINCLLENSKEAWLGARLAIGSEYDDKLFANCLNAFEAGWIETADFLALRWGRSAQAISNKQMRHLIQLLENRNDEISIDFLLSLLEDLPFNELAAFDSRLVFETVTKSIRDHQVWKNVCNKLIKWDKDYVIPLLDTLFTEMGKEYSFSYNSYIASLAEELLHLVPAKTWDLLVKHFEMTLPKWRDDLLNWLKGGWDKKTATPTSAPIASLPLEEILLWIEQDANIRAPFIAHATPGTLDDEYGGQLTRELLTRYLNFDGVKSDISVSFALSSGCWSGSRSEYLKLRKEKFHTWHSAGFQDEVNQWIAEVLDCLEEGITAAKIEEERTHFI